MSPVHIDVTLAEHANRFAAAHDGWEDVARAYASVSELVFVGGVVLLLVAGLVLGSRRLLVSGALAVASAGVAVVVGAAISALADRPRPFVADPQIHAFLAHAPDPGFPSDHALAAFAIATLLLLSFGLRTLPVLLAAIALAVSRVLVGIHYPGDVIAGALIGTASAWAVWRLAQSARGVAVTDAVAARLAAIVR